MLEKKRSVKVALIQHSCAWEQENNLVKAEKMVREAAARGANMVCLQELFAGQYFCQTVDLNHYALAQPIPGPVTERFQSLAKELKIVLIVPVYEYAMDGVYYNSAVVYDADGSFLGKYRKNHIPDYPQYLEKFYFTPGDLGYPVYDTAYGRIGLAICWDEWFPEPARIMALKGADIIFYPSAIAAHDTEPDMSQTWIDAIKAHGIHNNIYIAAVNRTGREDAGGDHMTFFGRSFISDPWGIVLAEGGRTEDQVVLADCDFSQVRYARDVNAFLRDRRTETYGPIFNQCLV